MLHAHEANHTQKILIKRHCKLMKGHTFTLHIARIKPVKQILYNVLHVILL